MKVLITGGAGFIGAALAQRLRTQYSVAVLDDFSIGKSILDGVTYFPADIASVAELPGIFDVCFHFAARSRIQPSFTDPEETLRVNTTGTHAVLQWARRHGIKVIYAGSSSIHADHTLSPYAVSKYFGEELSRLYRKMFDQDVSIVRFYNVYGPGEIVDGDWAALIGLWRRCVRNEDPLPIVGDGEQRRSFTHIDDIVDALIGVLQYGKPYPYEWELGVGADYSINEVFRLFQRRFPTVKAKYIPDQKGNYKRSVRHDDQALHYLEWQPRDRLKEYIESL